MKPNRVFTTFNLALSAFFLLTCCVTSVAQEAGGELGGGSGIFHAKNPETANKGKPRPPTPRGKPGNTRTPKPNASNLAEVEDLLDQGNQARDARNFPDAEKAYKAAVKLNSRDWRPSYGLGNVYSDQQRWLEAETAYRDAAAAKATNSETFVALSYVLLQPRSDGSQAKRFADAETSARRAIMLQNDNAVAHDRLGAALEARGLSPAESEQEYRKAIELDPQFAVAYVHLARLIRKDRKRLGEAEPLYGKALELAKDAPTLILIADTLQSETRYQDSMKPLKAALEMDPKNPSALFLLGRMYVVIGKYSDAEPYLQQAIEISPKSFAPYQVLGSAYLRENRLDDAEQVFMKAGAVAPPAARKDLAGSYGLTGVGDGYAGSGRSKDAARAYRAALKLDPDNADIQHKLAGLGAQP